MKRIGILIGCTLLLWAAAAYPAWLLGGEQALAYSAVAVALCLMPTALTLLWAEWSSRQSPEQQLIIILGGTGVRLGFVLGVGLLLYTLSPYFQQQTFWLCLLVFYLFTLALEMVLVVKGRAEAEHRQESTSARSSS